MPLFVYIYVLSYFLLYLVSVRSVALFYYVPSLSGTTMVGRTVGTLLHTYIAMLLFIVMTMV